MLSAMSGTGGANGSAHARLLEDGGSDALKKLKRGELSLDEYLDLQADLGVRNLEKLLDPDALKAVRDVVRAELSNDPVVAEMIAELTGQGDVSKSRG